MILLNKDVSVEVLIENLHKGHTSVSAVSGTGKISEVNADESHVKIKLSENLQRQIRSVYEKYCNGRSVMWKIKWSLPDDPCNESDLIIVPTSNIWNDGESLKVRYIIEDRNPNCDTD